MMREKDVEQYLSKRVKVIGGLALKLTTPTMDGIPDRLVLLPNGKIAFVELKAPKQKPRILQIKRIEQLRKLGFQVFVIDSKAKVGEFIDEIQATRISKICD